MIENLLKNPLLLKTFKSYLDTIISLLDDELLKTEDIEKIYNINELISFTNTLKRCLENTNITKEENSNMLLTNEEENNDIKCLHDEYFVSLLTIDSSPIYIDNNKIQAFAELKYIKKEKKFRLETYVRKNGYLLLNTATYQVNNSIDAYYCLNCGKNLLNKEEEKSKECFHNELDVSLLDIDSSALYTDNNKIQAFAELRYDGEDSTFYLDVFVRVNDDLELETKTFSDSIELNYCPRCGKNLIHKKEK